MTRVLVLSFALLGWTAQAQADLTDAVRCAEVSFSRAAERRDARAFRAHLDPDARFVGDRVFRGPDTITEAWAPYLQAEGPRIAWRPRFVEVLETGDLALTRGPYRLESAGPDGEPVVQWGTFNSVWRLGEDGRWRVVFDAGGPPAETPPADADILFDNARSDCPEPAD